MKKKNRWLSLAFDRLLSKSLIQQMLILVGLMVIMFALSHLALSLSGDDWRIFCEKKNISKWVFPLYLIIDANSFNSIYTADEVKFSKTTLLISCLTFVAGVLLFTGALISILTNVISRRVEKHSDGLIHYLNSGHYIIMGFDNMVSSIINDIFNRDPKAYILLLTAVDAKTIREKLRKSLCDEQIKHIIINYGLRTSKEFYRDIHLEASEEIFIVGLRSLSAHDAMNVENIDNICNYLKNEVKSGQKPKRITCVFEDLDTYASFKTTDIFKHLDDLKIEFVPYNFYSGWANMVLLEQQYKEKNHQQEVFKYPSVYRYGIKADDNKFVHLVFVGITNLSTAFAIEAAHLLHFPNFKEDTKQPKTRITFIDMEADKEIPEFVTRNHHLFEVQSYLYRDLTSNNSNKSGVQIIDECVNKGFQHHDFLDVEFEFIKGNVFSYNVQSVIREMACQNGRYLSIFLTMADQRKNFMMGMNMPDEVYDNEIPIFIRQDRSDNFVTNLRTAEKKHFEDKHTKHYLYTNNEVTEKDYHGRYAHIYPFGMDDLAFYSDEISLKRAKLINYLYATADYSNNHFQDPSILAAISSDSLWKKANEEWNKLTVALKWSNLYCAYSITTKLASLRAMRGLESKDTSNDQQPLSEDEINTLARVEHNRWNIEKLLMGYRKAKTMEDKYQHPEFAANLKKNKDIFIHHDIRPYDELPESTKQLDKEIVKYIPWILKMTE